MLYVHRTCKQTQPANVSACSDNKERLIQWSAWCVRVDGGARRAWKWNAQQGRQAEWQLVLHLPPRQAPLGECIPRVWPLYCPLTTGVRARDPPERAALSRKMK